MSINFNAGQGVTRAGIVAGAAACLAGCALLLGAPSAALAQPATVTVYQLNKTESPEPLAAPADTTQLWVDVESDAARTSIGRIEAKLGSGEWVALAAATTPFGYSASGTAVPGLVDVRFTASAALEADVAVTFVGDDRAVLGERLVRGAKLAAGTVAWSDLTEPSDEASGNANSGSGSDADGSSGGAGAGSGSNAASNSDGTGGKDLSTTGGQSMLPYAIGAGALVLVGGGVAIAAARHRKQRGDVDLGSSPETPNGGDAL